MILADHKSALGRICLIVDSMKPGQCVKFSHHDLCDIPTFYHNDTLFTAADRVLENIMGSVVTHSYHIAPDGSGITFVRHENTGKRWILHRIDARDLHMPGTNASGIRKRMDGDVEWR